MARKKKSTTAKKTAAPKEKRLKEPAQKKMARKSKSTKNYKKKRRLSKQVLPSVRVRMFRHGLGDCFLVTFDVDGSERHMLIDCGTLGEKSTKVKISDVANHVKEVIGNGKGSGKLDVVVATHEHQDHLSGFNGPMSQFANQVENVWLAWTENPDDPIAKDLAKYRGDLGQAVTLAALASPESELGMAMSDLLGFAGGTNEGVLGFAKTVNKAMEFVRTGLTDSSKQPHYFLPGELFEADWLPGFRVYILGPPRDPNAIKEMGDHGNEHLYGMTSGFGAASMLHVALEHEQRGLSPDEATIHERQLPFDKRFNLDDSLVRNELYPGYANNNQSWRTIENEWLTLASHLALQLDSITNNTSLALAIERIADGKVLLFPADAQLGNWKSWHKDSLVWKVKDQDGKERTVQTSDLLKRTVFYKTGHHGSHNATARDLGLEMMKQEADLVAFIPVDRKVALSRNPKGSWQMPARPLYRRLLEKTQGRVARSDIGWANDPGDVPKGDSEYDLKNIASTNQWQDFTEAQKKATHVKVTDIYVEYILT